MSSATDVASVLELYRLPFFDLLFRAHSVHRSFHDPEDIQRCVLLSIKTGGCPEDCGYCSQSAHHQTELQRVPLLSVEEVRASALRAREQGAQRFCMGAAWRNAPEGEPFERVLAMIREVKSLGLEACVTLGMLTAEQAHRLKEAGLDAYNHNLDTSREYYPKITTTRTYDDRLKTIRRVREAGITVCCGGILGLGESDQDRCALLSELAQMEPQPESVPINLLVPIPGTPLGTMPPVETTDLIRTIAVARILMPLSRVRLTAGRLSLNKEAQLLAFFAGANSIFIGEKLLTTPNIAPAKDKAMLTEIRA
ncbi:biotin synthase BioB [Granulicella sp. S156]|uniref:biotin synthase BioB n=1 Tax=Granulicella sp. S156 TaxID=1747224 RepID=UPI001C20BADB|nr:biotin synthase BioB [Granulicella sp. S156]